jgi:flagellar hook protein FlgE
VPSDPDFTTKQIYRTDSTGTGDFYLVATVPAGQASYLDSAADAAITGGTVLDDSALDLGSFNYYVTFYNPSTGFETRPTSRIGPISITEVGRRVRLENLPNPTSPDFDRVRIYRNAGASEPFYRVAELPLGVDSYIDSSPNSAITVSGNPILNLDGPPISMGLPLVDVVARDGSTYQHLFPVGGGTISFTGEKGGRELATKEFTYTNTTTVQQLLEFMNQALGIHEATSGATFPIPGSPGATLTDDGRIEFTSNYGIENELSIGLSAFQVTPAGALVSDSVPLNFTSTQEADGKGATASFVVYDSLGIPLNVSVSTYLEQTADNSFSYRWMANSSNNEPSSDGSNVDTVVGTGVITFDGFGEIQSISNSNIAIDREIAASASPLSFNLDFSQVAGLSQAGATNSGNSSLSAIRQDGFPPGTLSSFVISESGEIRGVFSNGTQRTLGQMVLARFANNAGLQQLGDNLYGVGVNSGLPVINDPGSNGVGNLTAGAVELSNTDIGENLIQLILASTQYRGGARVITAAQELLDELMALRR